MGLIGLSVAEANYYSALLVMKSENKVELGLVGAGLGDGIATTHELKILTYGKAMNSPDKIEWDKSIKREYGRMKENEVFMVFAKEDVPEDANIIDSTWSMKKKSSKLESTQSIYCAPTTLFTTTLPTNVTNSNPFPTIW